MHATWGGRAVVKWIFLLGADALLDDAIAHLNRDIQQTRQRRADEPEAAAHPTARQMDLRRARDAREQCRRAKNFQMKIKSANLGLGECSKCWKYRPMILCLQCKKPVCQDCRVEGYLQCTDCRTRTQVDYIEIPGEIDEHSAPWDTCGICYNTTVDIIGQCWRCRRRLCHVCGSEGPPLACVVCPASIVMRTSLREARGRLIV